MRLTINGQNKDITGASNVADIVAQFCKNPAHVITEINGNIVPNDAWGTTSLKEGDSLELVAFVGGG